MPDEILALDAMVTDCNSVIFDVANAFAGCIPGCHEILRRQGLMRTAHCLDPARGAEPRPGRRHRPALRHLPRAQRRRLRPRQPRALARLILSGRTRRSPSFNPEVSYLKYKRAGALFRGRLCVREVQDARCLSRRRARGALFCDRHEAARSAHDIVIIERNRPDDTFGWGVVLSDETLANLPLTTPPAPKRSGSSFVYWDDIAVHPPRHRHALGRARLLRHRPQAAAQYPAGPRPRARRGDPASKPKRQR